jgi:hypothetical protein
MADQPYLGSNTFPFLDNVTARIELIGFPNVLSSFCQFNSAPRISMFNHHLPQTMIVAEPEFNKVFTGLEHKFIDYTFNPSRRDHDCEILTVIPKYRDPLVGKAVCPEFYVIVLTHEPGGQRRLDYFTVNRYFMGSNDFGWIPEIENIRQVVPGEFLSKDTPITHSPAVKGNQYCLGVNANVIYGSFPETIEDAFVISESLARKLQTQQVTQKIINCRMDRRPLNLNGSEYEDKFLPDIGSTIREDGALCAFRPVHYTTVLADTDPQALREPLPLQDEIIYGEPGAKILDLTFNINRSKLNTCYNQAKQYDANNLRCWEDIFGIYTRYKDKGFKLTPKMSTLVRTAIYHMIAQETHNNIIRDRFRRLASKFEIEGGSGQTIEFIQAIVTYATPRVVSKGSKLTDQSGAKGVVGLVMPDECMPIDEYGIRADMMIDMNSPVGRNNPGQLYETGFNRIGEFVRRKVKEVNEEKGPEAAHATAMDFYRDVNKNYASLIERHDTTPKAKKETVDDVIANGPRVCIPPFLDTLSPSDEDQLNALTNMRAWAQKWGVKPSRVTYKSLQADGTYKQFTTLAEFSIGSKYIFQLHKIPEQFAPGPASVNHIGVPTKANYENKNYPVSVNPYRYGEDEMRVISMDTPIRETTRFQALMANSPTGVDVVIRSILLSDHPTRIKRMPISNGRLAETNAILALFHNTSASLGVETRKTRDDVLTSKLFGILAESDELTDSIYKTDIVSAKENQSTGERGSGVSKRSAQKREKVQKMLDDYSAETAIDDDGDDAETESED